MVSMQVAGNVPTRANSGDAGLDLRFDSNSPFDLAPGESEMLPTGTFVDIPEGHVGYVCSRSGLAAKHGLQVLNAPGVVDHGYHGEVKVILHNTDPRDTYTVQPGERIAQLVVHQIVIPKIIPVKVLDNEGTSERGAGGFGSSGTH